MAITQIPAEFIPVNAISGTIIADNAITTIHIASNAVESINIAENNITAREIAVNTITGTLIADNAITAVHIAGTSITATQIQDNAIGTGQLAGIARGKIIYGDSSGNPQLLTLGSNGQVLKSDGTDIAWASESNAITALNNATENELVTIGSTTTELNAESGLTWDTTTLAVTGALTAQSLTVDDITINGSTITDGGAFTLDVGGDISLDADGDSIKFLDGGTQFGKIRNISSNLYLYSDAQDKDMVFRGNDNGADVDALTLDMSDAGTATFNHDVKVTGQTVTTGGAASAPSYSFIGDTDTGISRPTTDAVNIVTGGSERVRITGNNMFLNGGTDARIQLGSGGAGANTVSNDTVHIRGDGDHLKLMSAANGGIYFEENGSATMTILTGGKVGIGTATPGHKLSVRTPSAGGGRIHLGYNGTSANTEAGRISSNSYDVDNSSYSLAEMSFMTSSANGYTGGIQFRTNSANSTNTRAAVRMTIDSVGSVGFGVADGDVTSDGTAARTYVGIIGAGNRGRLNIGTTAANSADGGAISFVNGANELAAIYNDTASGVQNKGVLHITSTSSIKIGSAASEETVFNESGIDTDFRVESDGNANMFFVNGGTNRVGIGTAGPQAPLEVSEAFGGAVGSTKVRITSRHTAAHVGQAHLDFAYVDDGNVAVPNITASIRSISSVTSPTNVGGILVFATKALGGGTTTLPVENFRIAANGDLTATDTSIGSNSDSRLKKNIESYTYDISKFKSYSPKKFDWINPTQHGDRSQQIGFIAQEQEIVDERFTGSITLDAGDGIENNPDVSLVDEDRIVKTSKFGQMDAMYISVIQQLITRLETAEARIATLEE